jgi:hypothetical protein
MLHRKRHTEIRIKIKHLAEHKEGGFIIEKSPPENAEGMITSPESELSWRRSVASRNLPTTA